MTTAAPLPPGTDVGRFRVRDEIGVGGMGRVYRAEVTERVAGLEVGDTVALKLVHPHLLTNPGFFKRFLREGEVGKRIRHPNVVATYDLDGINIGNETMLYMAMEYVEGRTLWTLFQELGPIPEELGRHLAREVAKGLRAIHELGVVHRDVKPENIIIGTDRSVKLMDLGIARMVEDDMRLSKTGAFVGSALYAAPEQFRGASGGLDARADLYSLGVVLYELATGTAPQDADDFGGILAKVLHETPPPLCDVNPRISPLFAALVGALLAKDPDERIGSAGELLEILDLGEESAWWRNRAPAAPAETVRAERRLDVARPTALVGREPEIAQLESVFRKTAAGEAHVVLIEGEVGAGKTRLVDAFVAGLRARGEDVNFLFGAFPPGGAASASCAFDAAFTGFLKGEPVAEALRARFHESPAFAASVAAHLRGVRSPGGADPLPADALPAALARLFRSLASERPTVLFVDDLQFAPRQGLGLFASLAASADRLMLVGAARPGLAEDWTADLLRLPHAHRILLPRLGIKDAARLVIAAVGSAELADELGFDLVDKSGGNPYFLFEIIRSLKEGHDLAPAGASPRATRTAGVVRLPASVVDVLKARIAALSDEDRDLVNVAACCGFEFDPRLVSDAMGGERVSVLRRLTRIERAHRIVHAVGDRFVFDHRGLFDVLVADVPDALSREYHANLAAALEASGGAAAPAEPDGARAAALTDLFLKAGDGAKALRHLAPALAHLDAAYSGEPAAALASQALAAPGLVAGAERFDMLLRQAERLALLGRHTAERGAVAEAVTLADRMNDAGQRARALVAHGRACFHAARYTEAIASLEEAVALASREGLDATEAEARAVLGQAHCETASYDAALAEHEGDLALRRKLGDADGEAAAMGMLGDVHCELGRFDRAHSCFRRERETGLGERDKIARARTKVRRGRMLFALGRLDDAQADFARARTLSQLLGSVRGQATANVNLGDTELTMGDADAARRHYVTATTLARESGIRHLHARALHGLASAAAAQGDQRTALEHASAALALRRSIGDRAGVVDSLVLVGRLRAAAGAADAARAALTEALELARKIGRVGGHVLAAAHLALLPNGDARAAQEALATFGTQTAIDQRIEAHALLWRATGSAEHLRETRELTARVLTHVPRDLRDAAAARMTHGAPVASGERITPAAAPPRA